ncbi:Metallo-dependent phosphatase-like protein [Collybia nuda]|uniref:Metallo-dependent phosphatase-like protein n=1 Tax=Collybia nuda TaxID=64659 RepID=A0A9P6CE75_9AGAR|nr:Metallo-dependent phosphatase-like protein [Collybia nuda]
MVGIFMHTLLEQLTHGMPTQHTILPLDKQHNLDPYPLKPRLTFKANGTFKLTIFSDLHFGENPWDVWGPEQDANSTRVMKRVLGDERPDYVYVYGAISPISDMLFSREFSVLNGDLITGENTFKENATTLIDQIVKPLNDIEVPFSSSHGNHDNQANISHVDEILREQSVAPLSYTRMGPKGVGGEGGPGNYWVPIYRTKTDLAPVLILWFFDSRGGFSPGANSTRLPDWVDVSVADWIESETKIMDEAWGPAEKRGALAFVHIPPFIAQELQPGIDSKKDPGLNADLLEGLGSVQATTDPTSLGKDAIFWDALNKYIKNLHALISGHDHGNEWCVREPIKDVIFCFDKHSGYGGYTGDDWGYGVRNLLFTSPDPNKGVETWIRLEEGETRAHITLNRQYGYGHYLVETKFSGPEMGRKSIIHFYST